MRKIARLIVPLLARTSMLRRFFQIIKLNLVLFITFSQLSRHYFIFIKRIASLPFPIFYSKFDCFSQFSMKSKDLKLQTPCFSKNWRQVIFPFPGRILGFRQAICQFSINSVLVNLSGEKIHLKDSLISLGKPLGYLTAFNKIWIGSVNFS